jgi:hypothetical protein
MSNTAIRYQGEDIPVLINITDAAGDPVNITDLAELFVYIINHKQNSILVRFSKAGGGGFQALVAVSDYIYRADILSGTTKNALPGMYDVDINVVQTDADYEDSEQNTIGIQYVFQLNKSVSKASSSG